MMYFEQKKHTSVILIVLPLANVRAILNHRMKMISPVEIPLKVCCIINYGGGGDMSYLKIKRLASEIIESGSGNV